MSKERIQIPALGIDIKCNVKTLKELNNKLTMKQHADIVNYGDYRKTYLIVINGCIVDITLAKNKLSALTGGLSPIECCKDDDDIRVIQLVKESLSDIIDSLLCYSEFPESRSSNLANSRHWTLKNELIHELQSKLDNGDLNE